MNMRNEYLDEVVTKDVVLRLEKFKTGKIIHVYLEETETGGIYDKFLIAKTRQKNSKTRLERFLNIYLACRLAGRGLV